MPHSHSPRAIAIVGLGCILPDAPDVPTFWNNLLSKRYSITETPTDRWSIANYYDPDIHAPDKTYSKIGGWVRGYSFDWRKWRMPPRVIDSMDQGQQWAVTIATDALADYGYGGIHSAHSVNRPLDTERTAVILGTAMGGELHYATHLRIAFPEYANALAQVEEFSQLPAGIRDTILANWHTRFTEHFPPITEDSMPGELPNIVSGRVANMLNLRGPNFITDAACASSFAAINAAFEMLTEGHVDAVLSGGVDRNMGVSSFVKFCKIGALSATGTRPFGDGADGFVMGEGAAAFLLKRLEDAERDGDKIYAVIRGVGGASDGKGKGITAPNPVGQQLAIQRAWENAGIDPATATLIEAHGTSTRVGDVVEVESLNAVFGSARKNSIALGSVKSNIGHLKAGAGAAGLLKAVLALHHKIIPPTLNARPANPNIDFSVTPFRLAHDCEEWRTNNGAPRRAGVSAYGFGGTNFHLVLEEHVPGMITSQSKSFAVAGSKLKVESSSQPTFNLQPSTIKPLRGILELGAESPEELKNKLASTLARVESGWTPPLELPTPETLRAAERLVIDFGTHDELLDRLHKAQKAMNLDNAAAWKAMEAQGLFRGSGPKPGKIAFMFPGQGSQYANMGRKLADVSPAVAEVFAEADRIMEPILGKPLTSYLFVDETDPAAVMKAEIDLMQTEITQPAMLTLDMAIYKLLDQYGFKPDVVLGHSLGEYAALIAAGVMPFAHALEATAARGAEMAAVDVPDKGKMAAVIAPYEEVEAVLKEVDGYVVPANINSHAQSVIGGESAAVEKAFAAFQAKGYQAMMLPVSHAFHTRIIAPAAVPLRKVLDRLSISAPQLPIVANLTGEFYPTTPDAIKDCLQQQVASPVQWVKSLHTLYEDGVRAFVEVGPKRALRGFANDVFKANPEVIALLTNHPKGGELETFNQALCGLYAAGYGGGEIGDSRLEISSHNISSVQIETAHSSNDQKMTSQTNHPTNGTPATLESIVESLTKLLQPHPQPSPISNLQSLISNHAYNRNDPPLGSVIISGTGLGLPGAEKHVMDPDNALRILRGEQFVDLIPERFRKQMLAKRITRLVKDEQGNGSFATIDDASEVIKLAGRPGPFDLADEYGVPQKLVDSLDITTQLAMAAGLDALREAGIPLVMTYKRTTTGKFLPERWMLPEALRDETGVIFASAFPGGDRFASEFKRYYTWQNRVELLEILEEVRRFTADPGTMVELNRRITALRETMEREPYTFDRRFLFRILSMGHSQFAEYIGARGPNTQVNAACASTTQAIALAEDWIRSGRARRVLVIAADDVTGENLLEWVGAGFLSLGAAATEDEVGKAALPFDRRRHGTIIGMGAAALVVESEDVVRERGMRGIVELLSSETRNSAFHGSRLDVDHIHSVLNDVITSAEHRFGLNRYAMAQNMVFMSHETYTPARGGSASAEVVALRNTFGEAATDLVVANTKGYTGHPMGVGIEDVIAIKILEHGLVPPVPNHREEDPDLGPLNLSRGGRYPVIYALHLAAGFGSQIAFALYRRIPGALDRVDNKPQYQHWLDAISGYDFAETEVVKRNLRVVDKGAPTRARAASSWQYGTGPSVRVGSGQYAVSSGQTTQSPAMPKPLVVPPPQPAVELPKAESKPEPIIEKPEPEIPSIANPLSPNGEAVKQPPIPNIQYPISEPQSPTPPITPSPNDLTSRVLNIVSAQTGYPIDILDPDLDLEADLGVDTVKQAETFAAIRAEFDIPRKDDLKLRDYPTLAHVIQFVRDNIKQLAVSSEQLSVVSEQADQPTVQPINQSTDNLTARVLAIVSEQTGYPQDILELDLDLEADLGVDTVKQAETFAAIRAEFDIPRKDDLKLRDYPTLAHVIQFVKDNTRSDSAIQRFSQLANHPTTQPINQPINQSTDNLTTRVLAIVSAQTGYPQDILELDLDLEADLGVDTVKQAETFAAIRAEFNIPRKDDLKLRDYPTLAHVIEFVKANTQHASRITDELANQQSPISNTQYLISTSQLPNYELQNANLFPRRVPTPSLRPALEFCKPTGMKFDENSRVIVAMDSGGVGKALANRLEKLGVTVLTLDPCTDTEALDSQLKTWAEHPIQGVYWLPALDVEPDLADLDLPAWHELNRVRVKNLYTTMRALYESVSTPGTFLVSATRLGGLHGYSDEGATAPLGGAVTGFTKAYKRERPDVLVKAVDFEPSRKTAQPADALLAETLTDPGIVEVGYRGDDRFTITLLDQPIELTNQPTVQLTNQTVFLVTGAAGSITSAIVSDLAASSGGVFYLLDLVPEPDPTDQKIALFRKDKAELQRVIIEEMKAAGERPIPAQIEKRVTAVERLEAALTAIEAVRAAGGIAHYYSVNLLDGDALARIVEDIRARYGKIDVLVHAGGIEISRALPDKDRAQFDLVFGIKTDGFFSLLRAAKDMPIGATVAFSSVAGRFGNAGQTDYAAANDLLCKLTSSFRRTRPETRGIVIDWTAWGGIGMATRGSIPTIMKAAGIDMLPPESGIPTVRRELLFGGGEVVIGGELGMLMEEWDVTGGVDLEKFNAWVAEKKLLMVGEVKSVRLYGGLEAETTLDPNVQPFLYDHAMEGTPLLPGVMGVETFAELATLLAPGYSVAAVQNVEFHAPFKFYRMEPQTMVLRAVAYPGGDGLIVCAAILSKRTLATGEVQEKVHFTGEVKMLPEVPTVPTSSQNHLTPNPSPKSGEGSVSTDAIYKIYFHGPAYRVIEKAVVEGEKAVGWMPFELPPNTNPTDVADLMSPRLIELCFQTAGVWQIRAKGEMALPLGIESVTRYAKPDGQRLVAVVEAVNGGEKFIAQVVDEAGTVYVDLKGYRTVVLPGSVRL